MGSLGLRRHHPAAFVESYPKMIILDHEVKSLVCVCVRCGVVRVARVCGRCVCGVCVVYNIHTHTTHS